MWWKTAAKRLEPWVPTSREYRREQLRAAAAASDAAGPRIAPPDAPALAPAPPDIEIHDAEIVDEHASDQVAKQEAPASQRSSARPTGAQMGKLGRLLGRLSLTAPEDQAVMLPWLTGRGDAVSLETLTREETARITSSLDGALSKHGGDTESTTSMLWAAYHDATATEPGDQADGEGSDE
jgi:hypothetical protein